MTDEKPKSVRRSGTGAYRVLRVVETGILLVALIGIGMFAWSIVDIVRIETAAIPAAPAAATASSAEPTSGAVAEAVRELPVSAWPGIFLFFGSLLVLQPVRAILMKYRGEDGSERDPATAAAARATAEALAASTDETGSSPGSTS